MKSLLLCLLMLPLSANAAKAVLTWTAPTQNTDGSALTNLAGYKVLYRVKGQTLASPRAVKLPESHANLKVPESDLLTIYVDKAGAVYVSPGEGYTETVPVTELGNNVKGWRIKNPGFRIALKGDKDAPYGTIEDVMKQLQEVKATNFNLVTDLAKTRRTGGSH